MDAIDKRGSLSEEQSSLDCRETDRGQEMTRFVGRGAQCRPANRFESIRLEVTEESAEFEAQETPFVSRPATEYFDDASKSIVSRNESPDIVFDYSVNVYRGCAHGCSYCYARPTHEYLGFDAGLDFETKVMVKRDAPRLLDAWLRNASHAGKPIMFSGVTDCYQPVEKKLELTRQCLQVCLDFRQPVMIVTKNRLVTRDLDLLSEMAARNLVHVGVSITSLDTEVTRFMEPRTSCPTARLATIGELSSAGVPTQVLVAPIVPGLTDHELPMILAEASQQGANMASYVILRLPQTVRPVFLDWLAKTFPNHAEKVENRLRSIRNGQLSDAQFGRRMRGSGPWAEQLNQTFHVFAQRHGLATTHPELNSSDFRSHTDHDPQRRLF